jgi:hypothetical protein
MSSQMQAEQDAEGASNAAAAGAAGSSIAGAFATYAAGQKAQALHNFNAEIASLQAQQALDRGRADSRIVRQRREAVVGAQRAGFSSQNIDIESGTALELQAETAQMSERDINQIESNAAREAWGYKTTASIQKWQGKVAARAATTKAVTSLLSAGAKMAGGMS